MIAVKRGAVTWLPLMDRCHPGGTGRRAVLVIDVRGGILLLRLSLGLSLGCFSFGLRLSLDRGFGLTA